MKQIITSAMISIELIKLFLSEELQQQLETVRDQAEVDFFAANGDKPNEATAAGEAAYKEAAADMINKELSSITIQGIFDLHTKSEVLGIGKEEVRRITDLILLNGIDETGKRLNELTEKLQHMSQQSSATNQLALEAKQWGEKMGKLAVEIAGHNDDSRKNAMQASADLAEAKKLVERAENAVHTAEGSAKRAADEAAESFKNSQKASDAANRAANAAASVRNMRVSSIVIMILGIVAIMYAAYVYYSKPTPGVSKEDVKTMIRDYMGKKQVSNMLENLPVSPRLGDEDKDQRVKQQTPPPPAQDQVTPDDEKKAEEKALKEIGG